MEKYLENLKISPKFQERLTDLFFDLNCKKSDLPKMIGLSTGILVNAFNVGMLPSTPSLIKIADFFNVSIQYLIGLTEKEDFVKSDVPTTFQMRLSELKMEKKVTNGAIARKLGFDRGLFTKWTKKNYLPTLEITLLVAGYFQVSIDYMLGRTDDK